MRLLIRYFAFVRYRRNKLKYNGALHQLFIDFKKAYVPVRREVLCNILIELRVAMKLIRLIKMRLNETEYCTYSYICLTVFL
jgi:hypothetical protein